MSPSYQVIGFGENGDPSKLFGGKKNMEIMLKSLNFSKQILVDLGQEYSPAFIWNEDIPEEWVVQCGELVIEKLKQDINYVPDEQFIAFVKAQCRQKTERKRI